MIATSSVGWGVLGAVAVGVALWSVLQFSASRYFLKRSFAAHEIADGVAGMQRLAAAIDQNKRALEHTSQDWSNWDDTFAFVAGAAPNFPENNLTPQDFVNLQTNFIAYLNRSGEVIYHREIDLHTLKDRSIDPATITLTRRAVGLLTHANRLQREAGMLLVGKQLVVYAAQPVLPSNRRGNPNGVQVFGWSLDARRLSELTPALGMNVELLSLEEARRERDIVAVMPLLDSIQSVAAPIDEHPEVILYYEISAAPRSLSAAREC